MSADVFHNHNREMQMKKITTFIFGIMLMMLSSHALAVTVGGTMAVTAGVIASCTVATTPVNFGNNVAFSGYGNLPSATGSVDVNCSSTLAYTIAMDGGQNALTSTSSRKMADATGPIQAGNGHALGYYLKQPTGTTRWGDCDTSGVCGAWGKTSALVFTSTGTGALQSHTVNATIYTTGSYGLALVLPGSFSDTVNVTVTY